MQYIPFIILYILSLLAMLLVAFYVYRSRKDLDEMHGMMAGMGFGMFAGLLTATFYVIPTGDFLWGVIYGSLLGLVFGIVFGSIGGHLGIVEGIIAGPMGGMMGAMLGQMVRPFNIEIFMPFFMGILSATLFSLVYAVHHGSKCCEKKQEAKKDIPKLPAKVWLAAVPIAIILLAASLWLPFSLEEKTPRNQSNNDGSSSKLPPALQQIMKEEREQTKVSYDHQEINLRIMASKYAPNVIEAKKGLPLKINLIADENAGCTREIVFPDFGIDAVVPAGGSKTVELTPTETGTFSFRCSMDMVHGKLIVTD